VTSSAGISVSTPRPLPHRPRRPHIGGRALRSRGFEVSTITIGCDGRWTDGQRPLGECAVDSVAAAMHSSHKSMSSFRQSMASWARTGRWLRCAL
jgi:hypothetical protein